MKTGNKSTTALVGGILFILYGVVRLFLLRGGLAPITVIYYLGFIALGIGLIVNVLYASIAGAAVVALIEAYWTIQSIQDSAYYGSGWFWVFAEAAILAACVLLIIMMIPRVGYLKY